MKKKAIAELEAMDWLREKLVLRHKTDAVRVCKSGGDAHIWFLRTSKISGEPDYVADIDGKAHLFEFQYADRDDLTFYDFKVSKVGKKIKGKRHPHQDREFLYIIKPLRQWAIFTPSWVMENGKVEGVPAWGNRTAYRIPKGEFESIFASDSGLSDVIERIDQKIKILDFQSNFLRKESEKLSRELEDVVDHKQEFRIIPKTLEGFYKACFLMEKIKRYPTNRGMWLIYGASFYSDSINSRELARLMYALDFLLWRDGNSPEE